MTTVCTHCEGALALRRRRTVSSVTIVRQCVRCAWIAGPLSAREIRDLDPGEVEMMRWAEQRKKRMPNSRRRAYEAHLKSPQWKALRQQVLERDQHVCQLKLWACTGRATTVHHTAEAYENLGHEKPEHLVAACASCQLRERERRITRHVLG